jgi:hypothetical protein
VEYSFFQLTVAALSDKSIVPPSHMANKLGKNVFKLWLLAEKTITKSGVEK